MTRAWHIKKNDQVLGPLTDLELRSMAGDGRLEKDDLIKCEGMADWKAAGTIKGLFSPASVKTHQAIKTASEKADKVSQKLWFLDLKFEQFATPRLIGFVFGISLFALGLTAIGGTLYAVWNLPILQAVLVSGLICVELLFLAVCFRVFLEMTLVVFRIAEHLSHLRHLHKGQ